MANVAESLSPPTESHVPPYSNVNFLLDMFLMLFHWLGILFDLLMLLSLHNKHTPEHTSHVISLGRDEEQRPLDPAHRAPLGHKDVVFMLTLT